MAWDVIIVGGGPAGLSAALMLGRCRRSVIVIDAGEQRNARARAIHGFLSRDGIPPLELLRIGREELTPYGVEFRRAEAVDASPAPDGGFTVELRDGSKLRSRAILLATGVVDELPDLPGIGEFYGSSVHHCPYCDGWEARDLPIAVHGGAGLAISMKTWSGDVVLCTDGRMRLDPVQQRQLARAGIPVITSEIARLEGSAGQLERIVFRDGEVLPRRKMFFAGQQFQRSRLAEKLGCRFNKKGTVRTDIRQASGVPGVWVAGDAAKDVQFVIVAAAEGAKAGMAINMWFQRMERGE